MQFNIFRQGEGGKKKNINFSSALSFFIFSSLISFSMIGCGGGGGGGGGGGVPLAASGGTINPTLFSGWQMTNGPFSGIVFSLSVDPNNSQKVYGAVQSGGLFTSDDGGQSWIHIDGGLENLFILAVAVAADGQIMYVGTKGDGIYKTVNGGMSWSPVNNGLPVDAQGRYFEIDYLIIDPINNNVVYAIIGTKYYLYRTTSGGVGDNAWVRVGLDLPFEPVEALTLNPADTQILYAGTYSNGVWKSTNRGDSWNPINGNLPPYINHFVCLAIDSVNNILYAGSTTYGLYKTLDDGVTWQFVQVGPNTVNESWDALILMMDPVDKSTIYTYVTNVSPAPPGDEGIYRTFDGGINWEEVSFYGNYGVRDVIIAPSDGNVVYTTTSSDGLFMTNDIYQGQIVWNPVGNGLVDTPIYTTELDPWNNNQVYAGTDEGFYSTTNGGLTWERKGLQGKNVFALVSDPNNMNIVYAATDMGVYKTTNGGDSWSSPSGYQFNCLAMGKISPNRNVIFGGNAFGMGIYRAEDDGSTPWDTITWEAKNNGLTGDEKYVQCLAMDTSDPSILYAGTGDIRMPGPVTVGKIIKTSNGGDNWDPKTNGLPSDEPIYSLTIDPYNPQIMYAGTYVGFYASSDGGDTWEFKDGGLGQRYIRSISIDPMDSKKVCAGTYDDGAFASIDGGKNWIQVDQGLTGDLNKRIISLAMDVKDIDNPVVYAGTGCGVFKAYK